MNQLLVDISAAKTEILMDIPEGSVLNEKEFINAFENAQKRGVKVLIRAEKPNTLSQKLSKFCHMYSIAWSPVTVIDNQISWYGAPVMETAFISEGNKLPIRYWPVIRFEGERTADTIITLLEMHRVHTTASAATSVNTAGFFSFIDECDIKCKHCGSKLVLKKGRSFFLACSKYPRCKNTTLIDKSLVDAYITQNGLKCKKDGYPLIAALSKYGVFARCKNPIESHCYDLGEI